MTISAQKKDRTKPSMVTLLLLIALPAIAAVLFTPAIPAIKTQFNATSAAVQWTVSVFLLGYAAGQIIYAPIANRVGRKPTIYLACIIGIIGSFFCALAGHINNFDLLIAARFIMAIGTSAGLVLTLTIINDVYNHVQTRKAIALVTLAFAIFPGIAIFLGGFLVNHFAWESCFYFTAAYILLVLFLCFFLPETKPNTDTNSLKPKIIITNYCLALKSEGLILYSSMWGLCSAIIYIFAATAPIICITSMRVTPAKFGLFNLFTSIGYVVGALLARKLNNYISSRKVMLLGLSLMTLGCIALLLYSQLLALNIWEFYLPSLVIFIGMPLVFTNASALATKKVSDKATGSSISSFLTMILAVFSLFLMGALDGNVEHMIAELFVIITFLIWLLFYFTRGVVE